MFAHVLENHANISTCLFALRRLTQLHHRASQAMADVLRKNLIENCHHQEKRTERMRGKRIRRRCILSAMTRYHLPVLSSPILWLLIIALTIYLCRCLLLCNLLFFIISISANSLFLILIIKFICHFFITEMTAWSRIINRSSL